MKNFDVSVIILTHNAKSFLRDTLNSVRMQKGVSIQMIVVDNQSTDGTSTMIQADFKEVEYLYRDTPKGFSAGNNLGVARAHAPYVLFLNPDASFTQPDDLQKCLSVLQHDPSIGALTARVNLVSTGGIDETCHRGFPTPWASFTHFSGLSKLFPSLSIFNHYTKNYLGYDSAHEIDSVGGMFMLVAKSVGDQLGWWDEDYVFYGEDLDFCYRLQQAGYHNYFYPGVIIHHFKGATTGMSKQSQSVSVATKETTRQVKIWSIEAMELFYKKHYLQKYPFCVSWLVFLGIKVLKLRRLALA